MTLTRDQISTAVDPLGWRLLVAELATAVPATGLADAADKAARAVRAAGDEADGHLRVTVQEDRVGLTLQDRSRFLVTGTDLRLAADLTDELGLTQAPPDVETFELAVDALDIAAVRPFWQAVLGYVDTPYLDDDGQALVDPRGRAPSLWFQQMDAPRPQRNRLHVDIVVPRDEADARLRAALDAGGTLLSAARARAFWVLADPEGNEVCLCTCDDRDGTRPDGS